MWTSASGAQLPTASPEKAGFSARRLDYIDDFFADKVNAGKMAGIVILIARHGRIVHFSAIGYADLEKKTKLTTESIFRLYSMTKPITAVALMTLYEQGRVQLTDPIAKYIPEFRDLRVLRVPDGALEDTVPMERAPTVEDLIRHTAGFSHGLSNDSFDAQYARANVFGLDVTLAEMMSKLLAIPLRYQPGTKWVYGVGPDIEARLIELLSGESFDAYLRRHLFEPLGMVDAGFWVPPEKLSRLAAVHWLKEGRLALLDSEHGHPDCFLCQPWSVNSYATNHNHKGGSFGLVSTVADYWRFAQMLLNGGQLNGVRILSPAVVDYMVRDHTAGIDMTSFARGQGVGLGVYVVKDPAQMGYVATPGSFWGSGAATTDFWVDRSNDLVVVAMTQHLGIPGLNSETLRPQLMTLVYSALTQ
jgi:CubicO group peptidase (beta-lactamase class C family)